MSHRSTWVASVIMILVVGMALPATAQQGCKAVYGSGSKGFALATGSPGELGLIEALAEAFNATHDAKLCWKKAGSGKSLRLLKAKEVDMVAVHAPAAEKKAVEEGWAEERTLIGSNEFYIVGPKDDPAGISEAKTATDAYARIAGAKARFFSRSDNSGTHKKEMSIWNKAGIDPKGGWYIVTNDFMMATLKKADKEKGYFMTDSSTWVVAKNDLKNLAVLFRGDPYLINVYHALCAPKGSTSGAQLGAQMIDFMASDEGQEIIATYGQQQYGDPLYNDASYAKQYDH